MNCCKGNEKCSRRKSTLIQQAWLWILFIRAYLKTSQFISDLAPARD